MTQASATYRHAQTVIGWAAGDEGASDSGSRALRRRDALSACCVCFYGVLSVCTVFATVFVPKPAIPAGGGVSGESSARRLP